VRLVSQRARGRRIGVPIIDGSTLGNLDNSGKPEFKRPVQPQSDDSASTLKRADMSDASIGPATRFF